ncbi:hypothetical protein LZ31DRAFT_636306 [Colletotrichum somersetense]|nr:hypothetical protein LZ31DRAFT_636306 [Colletotrichum somersetense]
MLTRGLCASLLALASLTQAAPMPQEQGKVVSRDASPSAAELESRYIYTQHAADAEKASSELESRYIYTQHATNAEGKADTEMESS